MIVRQKFRSTKMMVTSRRHQILRIMNAIHPEETDEACAEQPNKGEEEAPQNYAQRIY